MSERLFYSIRIVRTTTVMMALLSISMRFCRGFSSSLSSSTSARSRNSLVRIQPDKLGNTRHCRNYNNARFGTSLSEATGNNNLITSSKSQTVKKIQALLSKRKQRMKLGQTIIEGPRMVFDMLDNPKTAHLVKQVLVSAREYELRDDYRSKLFGDHQYDDLLVQLVHPDIFPDCTDTMTPQGIVAIVDIPGLENTCSTHTAPMYLVLDGVSDPGNLGTLLRTSLAVGVAGVVLLPDCCDVWNPKAVRSAMGASFQIPIVESPSWSDAKSELISHNGVQKIYAATMIEASEDENDPAASRPYFDVDWREGPSALVIGSEGNGLSPVVREDLLAGGDNQRVLATHIPMAAGIESLNAAVCGSVILFEYARQCQQTGSN